MSKWIKKGDKVLITAGNDRGRTGNVLRRKGDKVVVQTPSIIEMEMPIHVSNLRLCDEDGKAIHVKTRQTKKEKELIYVKGDKEVVLRTLRKVK